MIAVEGKLKYVFYDDGTYLSYAAIYYLENGELQEEESEEYSLYDKWKYTGDVMQDGDISLSDIQYWRHNPTKEQKSKLMTLRAHNRDATNEYFSALKMALAVFGKTFEDYLGMSEAEKDKFDSTKEVQEAKKKRDEANKAYNDFEKTLKYEWLDDDPDAMHIMGRDENGNMVEVDNNTRNVTIENGKVKMN